MQNRSLTVYTDGNSPLFFLAMFTGLFLHKVILNGEEHLHGLNNRPTQLITFIKISDDQWEDIKRNPYTVEQYNKGNIQNFGE